MSESKRPTFGQIYMKFAFTIAERSICSRLKVGTVITSTDFRKVLSIGYNGNASGLPNKCDSDEQGNCGCLHSEENAVINCDTARHIQKIVFVTHLPCPMCAKRLVNLGNVIKVNYAKDYRKSDSIEILKQSHIEIEKIPYIEMHDE
jgi:dCMP deaminase